MQAHKTVSRAEWLEARRALLAKEKELLKAKDALRRETRELPWVQGRQELRVRGAGRQGDALPTCSPAAASWSPHFMLGPGWRKAASAARSAPTRPTARVVT
jgi:predicted dithiol-disulfide oxidoreductase (DUF899 family)